MPGPQDTRTASYSQRLGDLSQRRWKQVLDVQAPYRWQLRQLLRGHERVLDVGCGLGRNLRNLGRGVGVDHNPTSVAATRAAGLVAWTTEQWPQCPDAIAQSYDALLLSHVLEHLDEQAADTVVRSYLPYLRPRARLVLICPQESGFASDPTHIRWVDAEGLRASAVQWGFQPRVSKSFPLPRAAGKVFRYNEFVLAADRN